MKRTQRERPAELLEEETPSRSRVLLVDDHPDALEPLQLLLEMVGYEVRTAETGEEALTIVEEYRPHVAVLDIGLPGIDGCEVGRTIRQRPWGKDILLLALTGWGHEKDRQRTRAAGFDEHLIKPVDLPYLKERIRQVRPM